MATSTITLKTDTTANWEASNRVLVMNEPALERTESGLINMKIGDGVHSWGDLPYVFELATLEEIRDYVNTKYNTIVNISDTLNTTITNANAAAAAANAAAAAANAAVEDVAYEVGIDDTQPGATKAYSSSMVDSITRMADTYARDGKIYGVKFPVTSYNSTPIGTRTQAAVGLVAGASTNTTAAQNDFDDIPCFRFVRVNGYVRADGEFIETAIEGDGKFARDGSNGDVYIRYQLSYFRYLSVDNGNYTEIQITDTPKADGKGGWCPFGIFVRPDKSLKKYAYIAAYEAGYNSSGLLASISGVQVAHGTYANKDSAEGSTASNIKFGFSNNLQLTEIKKKGTQYCGMTTRDVAYLQTRFLVEFATKNSQNIMAGCTDFNVQVQFSVATTDQEYVIVSNADADLIPIGCAVSVGSANGTSISRNEATMHSKAFFRLVTSKEEYDSNNTIIHIDNGGTSFSTTTSDYISTMAWYTGATDGVLGTSGSYVDNTSGKYPMMYAGVENFYGNLWTIMSDVIISSYIPYICYDCKKYAANKSNDYSQVGYSTTTTSSKYVKTLGYDSNHPSVQLPIEVNGSATTYYCDYWYISSGNNHQLLFGGNLSSSTYAGAFSWAGPYAVTYRAWNYAARLSANGQSVAF